jgi:hypothetical protein
VVGVSTVIELLAEAHTVGLALSREPDDTLRIRGPRAAGPIARQLLARKNDVLTTVSVYNGQVAWLDWRKGTILEQPQPCVLCGRQTLLIEPYDGRPCHKTCAEDAIGQRAAIAPGNSQTS